MTVRGFYRNGQVRLLETPEGIEEGEVTVTLANVTAKEASSRETRRQLALERLRNGIDLGGSPYLTRDELHDRVR